MFCLAQAFWLLLWPCTPPLPSSGSCTQPLLLCTMPPCHTPLPHLSTERCGRISLAASFPTLTTGTARCISAEAGCISEGAAQQEQTARAGGLEAPFHRKSHECGLKCESRATGTVAYGQHPSKEHLLPSGAMSHLPQHLCEPAPSPTDAGHARRRNLISLDQVPKFRNKPLCQHLLSPGAHGDLSQFFPWRFL